MTRMTTTTAAGALAALALTGCGALPFVGNDPTQSRLWKATDKCKGTSVYLQANGNADSLGESVFFDTKGEDDPDIGDDFYPTYEQITCVLTAIKAPAFVTTHIGQTSSNDGPQEEEWDGFKARWKYHPDDGLAITIIDTRLVEENK